MSFRVKCLLCCQKVIITENDASALAKHMMTYHPEVRIQVPKPPEFNQETKETNKLHFKDAIEERLDQSPNKLSPTSSDSQDSIDWDELTIDLPKDSRESLHNLDSNSNECQKSTFSILHETRRIANTNTHKTQQSSISILHGTQRISKSASNRSKKSSISILHQTKQISISNLTKTQQNFDLNTNTSQKYNENQKSAKENKGKELPGIKPIKDCKVLHPTKKPSYIRTYKVNNPLLYNNGNRKKSYKTTVEKWRPGFGTIICPKCGSNKRPIIKSYTHKVSYSPLGAACILACWPFCFLPCLFQPPAIENLHCAVCDYFLGKYDPKTTVIQPNPVSDKEHNDNEKKKHT